MSVGWFSVIRLNDGWLVCSLARLLAGITAPTPPKPIQKNDKKLTSKKE
jgi:hypothetical protein